MPNDFCTVRRSDSIGTRQMNLEPPSGSSISVTTNDTYPLIVVPHTPARLAGRRLPRWLAGLFLLVWLGMWPVGFSVALSKLLSGGTFDRPHVVVGPATPVPPQFLVFWLVGWTLGGAIVVYSLAYQVFRPSVPESLRLMPDGVIYDSGIPAPHSGYVLYGSSRVHLRLPRLFVPKRTRIELDRRKLQSLRLRETNDGNRLTVDADALRLDIAQSATEIEREWLYQLLTKRYSLPLPLRQ